MVEGKSQLFITGPGVIEAVTHEKVSFEDLGGAKVHSEKSGVCDLVAADEVELIHLIKEMLSLLPNNYQEFPPRSDTKDDPERRDEKLLRIIPSDSKKFYDSREILQCVLDDGYFFEIKPRYAKNILTGLGRMDGWPVGVIANQAYHLAGALDVDSSDKGSRFIRFCDAFNIPLLTFMDVPGFLPGVDQEHRGIIRHGAKILYAYSDATVPLVTIITRKAYGGAYVVMCSRHIGADVVLGWPTTECAVMGSEGAANIIFRKEIAAAKDPEQVLQEKIDEYRDKFANPWIAASHGFIDDVIEPRETRSYVFRAFEMLRNKRKTRPPRKHGNIPL